MCKGGGSRPFQIIFPSLRARLIILAMWQPKYLMSPLAKSELKHLDCRAALAKTLNLAIFFAADLCQRKRFCGRFSDEQIL